MNLFKTELLVHTVIAFFAFSFVTVMVYIINDIVDRSNDLLHPVKSKRPIASGKVSVKTALTVGLLFLAGGIALSLLLDRMVLLFIAVYFVMNVAYSLWLKKVAILDVFIIGFGFCLRVMVGSYSIGTSLSYWMLLATFSLSLFLGFSKRLSEITTLGNEVNQHRKNYNQYTTVIIDKLIVVSAAFTAISYSLYTMDSSVLMRFGNANLVITIPFVIFGLFRYMYLVYCENQGTNPEEIAVKDPGIISAVGLWLIVIVYLLYVKSGMLNGV